MNLPFATTPPQARMVTGGILTITQSTAVHGAPAPLVSLMRTCLPANASDAYTSINFVIGIPDEVAARAASACQGEYVANDEGFIVEAIGDAITLYCQSQQAFFCAGMTLMHHAPEGQFAQGLLWDYPMVPLRGLKWYIPPRASIPEFYKVIDLLVVLRMNAMMLEIGGAMEYKRHPEVNEGWEEYCAKTKAYPTGTEGIQDFIYPWRKNSIHNENGGGSWLTQAELQDIIDYATARGIEIIPECPSTSHCDYMLTRHRELAEHPEDEYADTFCTEEPKAYELLFDLLDEVIDLFKPRIINIGHDEYYNFKMCPKCKDKHPVAIFVDDVTRIHDFLASRNVRTMMWCDKLLNCDFRIGYGGAANFSYKAWNVNSDFFNIIPAVWPSVDLLPRDIICLHWYWGMGDKYEKTLLEKGYEVCFGNFSGVGMEGWKTRHGEGVMGGFCSNWSTADILYLQRNGALFDLAYNANLFWDRNADRDRLAELAEKSLQMLYAANTRALVRDTIQVTHNTDIYVPYQSFIDGIFIDENRYGLGHYVARYADGTTTNLPVTLGFNIGYKDQAWHDKDPQGRVTGITGSLRELSYTTLPHRFGYETWCTTSYTNPHPDKQLVDLTFVANPDFVFVEVEQNEKEQGIFVARDGETAHKKVPQVTLREYNC